MSYAQLGGGGVSILLMMSTNLPKTQTPMFGGEEGEGHWMLFPNFDAESQSAKNSNFLFLGVGY